MPLLIDKDDHVTDFIRKPLDSSSNDEKWSQKLRDFNARDKEMIADEWADVLNWKIHEVSPSILFTVGGSTTKLISSLQRRKLIPLIPTSSVIHYSAYKSDHEVKARMLAEVSEGLATISEKRRCHKTV